MPRGWKPNGIIVHKLRDRPRHRLNCESEIIRDVLTSHRQLDLVAARNSLGHHSQEGHHPLSGAEAPEQQHMLLHALKFPRGMRPELTYYVAVPRCERHYGAALDDQNARVDDRLGGGSI